MIPMCCFGFGENTNDTGRGKVKLNTLTPFGKKNAMLPTVHQQTHLVTGLQ